MNDRLVPSCTLSLPFFQHPLLVFVSVFPHPFLLCALVSCTIPPSRFSLEKNEAQKIDTRTHTHSSQLLQIQYRWASGDRTLLKFATDSKNAFQESRLPPLSFQCIFHSSLAPTSFVHSSVRPFVSSLFLPRWQRHHRTSLPPLF